MCTFLERDLLLLERKEEIALLKAELSTGRRSEAEKKATKEMGEPQGITESDGYIITVLTFCSCSLM